MSAYPRHALLSAQTCPESILLHWLRTLRPITWRNVEVLTVRELELFETCLERLPWVADHLQQVALRLEWEQVVADLRIFALYPWFTNELGSVESFAFADRVKLAECLKSKLDQGTLAETFNEYEAYDRELLDTASFSSGPDGKGELTRIKSMDDLSRSLETCLRRISNLCSLAWQTEFVPMSDELCAYLGQLDSLVNVRLSQQGEFRVQRWSAPPLWKLFPAGKEFETVVLGSNLLPLDELVGPWGRAGLSMGNPIKPQVDIDGGSTEQTAFDASRMLNVPIDQLDWSERPVAVMHRTIKALAKTKSRVVLLEEECGDLLRFRALLPFWLQIQLASLDYHESNEWVNYYVGPKSFRLAVKFRALRLAMFDLAHSRGNALLLQPDDLLEVAVAGDGSVPSRWIKEDAALRRDLAEAWNSMVRGNARDPRLHSVVRNEDIVRDTMRNPDLCWFAQVTCGADRNF